MAQIHDPEMMESLKLASSINKEQSTDTTATPLESCNTDQELIDYLESVIQSLRENDIPAAADPPIPPPPPPTDWVDEVLIAIAAEKEKEDLYADLPPLVHDDEPAPVWDYPADLPPLVQDTAPIWVAPVQDAVLPPASTVAFDLSPIKKSSSRLRRRRRPPTPHHSRKPLPPLPVTPESNDDDDFTVTAGDPKRVKTSYSAESLTQCEADAILSRLERGELDVRIDMTNESTTAPPPISSLFDKLLDEDDDNEGCQCGGKTTICEEVSQVWSDVKNFFINLCTPHSSSTSRQE